MGITISQDTLENMMKKFDNDSDGSIDLEEFKPMVHGMKDVPQESSRQSGGLTWLKKALGKSKKLSVVAAKKTRKLDAAYCMSDIDKVIDVYSFMIKISIINNVILATSIDIHYSKFSTILNQ